MIPVKVYLLPERHIRRFLLTNEDISLAAFRQLLSQKISLFYNKAVLPHDIYFQYADDEDEWIEVSNEEEWIEALRIIPNTLKAKVSWTVSTSNPLTNSLPSQAQTHETVPRDDPMRSGSPTFEVSKEEDEEHMESTPVTSEPNKEEETQIDAEDMLASWESVSFAEAQSSDEQDTEAPEQEQEQEPALEEQSEAELLPDEPLAEEEPNQEEEPFEANALAPEQQDQQQEEEEEVIDEGSALRQQEEKVQLIEQLVQGVTAEFGMPSTRLFQCCRTAISKARDTVTFPQLMRELDRYDAILDSIAEDQHKQQQEKEQQEQQQHELQEQERQQHEHETQPPFEFQAQLDSLREMGFTHDEAALRALLEQHEGNIETVVSFL